MSSHSQAEREEDRDTIPELTSIPSRQLSATTLNHIGHGAHRESRPFSSRISAITAHQPLFLSPWEPHLRNNAMSSKLHFQPESSASVLTVTCSETTWKPHVSDDILQGILGRHGTKEQAECAENTHVVIFAYLEEEHKAKFHRRVSFSEDGLRNLVQHIDMHDAAVLNLLGRPDYWSAFGRRKDIAGQRSTGFEFFCQHPRWRQSSPHDKGLHLAPCSIYLYHDELNKTSYSVISAGHDDTWVRDILLQVGVPDSRDNCHGPGIAAAESPFLLHALVSGIAFHQSTDYIAKVREDLMSQIRLVNKYSNEAQMEVLQDYSGSHPGRKRLSDITKELHKVSQTCDSGIANAEMSIKLTEALVQAEKDFCLNEGQQSGAVRQIRDSLGWTLKTWDCQKNWLVSYKARKDTAMNFVFNLVTQQDNSVNIDIANQSAKHGSSMNAITILTMVFLPGTFTATIFGCGILNNTESHGFSDLMNPFLWVFVPLTVVTMALWFYRQHLTNLNNWAYTKMLKSKPEPDLETGKAA